MKHSISEAIGIIYIGVRNEYDDVSSRQAAETYMWYWGQRWLRKQGLTKSPFYLETVDFDQDKFDTCMQELVNLKRDLKNLSTSLVYFKPQSSNLPLKASEAVINPIYWNLLGRDTRGS